MFSTIGDRSQMFRSMQDGHRLKSNLNQLSHELSTGKAEDLASHLSGRTYQVMAIDQDIRRIESHIDLNTGLSLMLDGQQQALSSVTDRLEESAARLVGLHSDSNDAQFKAGGLAAQNAFEDIVGRLNGSSAGRKLFGGTAVDRSPLASADTILSALETVIAGQNDPVVIESMIEDWFADDVNGFGLIAYDGAIGPSASARIGRSSQTIDAARADDMAIRDALASVAIAALADRPALGLSRASKAELMRRSGERAFGAASGVNAVAARIGESQALIETQNVRLMAERTTLSQSRNDRTLVDPFETATRLQDAQRSLEIHYAATAKLSRLSLANFL